MLVCSDHDTCADCKTALPSEDPRPNGVPRTPCPRCGSTKRIKSGEAHIDASVNVKVDAKLIIGWQEVDRLLDKAEYGAALLVAAVNAEFILWEKLRLFTPAPALAKAPNEVRSIWGKIQANQDKTVTLSSLLKIAEYVTQCDTFALSPTWDPLVRVINDVRNRIAHERGYFALLTRLRDPDWPETRIRQVLEDAKQFCHGNAP